MACPNLIVLGYQGRTTGLADREGVKAVHNEVCSLNDFKRDNGQMIAQMRESGNSLVLTIDGKTELIVQDSVSYQKLLDRMDELETLDGIKRGVADVEAGRLTSLSEFEIGLRAKHGLTSPPH